MKRGIIYVLRDIKGVSTPCALVNQGSFKEWAGCFSAL